MVGAPGRAPMRSHARPRGASDLTMGPPTSEADSLTTILKCELRCKDQRWKQWAIKTWKDGGRGRGACRLHHAPHGSRPLPLGSPLAGGGSASHTVSPPQGDTEKEATGLM